MKTHRRRGNRATFAGLALAALVTGGAVATAPAASAEQAATSRSAVTNMVEGVRIESAPAAAGIQLTAARSAAAAASVPSWTPVQSLVAGARLRAFPISGPVLRLIPRYAHFSVFCKRTFGDGYAWGYAWYAGTRGWVRGDLWAEVQYTGPGAPPFRKVQPC